MAEIFREPLTEYCREELAKFTTFLTSKKFRNWPVFGWNRSIDTFCRRGGTWMVPQKLPLRMDQN